MDSFALHIPEVCKSKLLTGSISINGKASSIIQSSQDLEVFLFGQAELNGCIQQAEHIRHLYQSKGQAALETLTGHFALIAIDYANATVLAMTDKFASINLYYFQNNNGISIATSLAEIKTLHENELVISNQSIYHYIYFHCIPSPSTIYHGVLKLEPAFLLSFSETKVEQHLYWKPNFTDSDANINVHEKQQALRDALSDATKPYANNENAGAFLSGGLDSSSVTAFLSLNSKKPVNTFTIGFSEPGYDEKVFAQAVADKFKTKHHTYDVTPKDIYEYLPQIARYYDEPFGNSSALPTFFCAKFARQNGVDTLLAGDGGDELFAGNERYAKQKIFERYLAIPSTLKAILDGSIPGIANTMPIGVLKKAASYVKQANVHLPERLQHYNFLNQNDASQVFTKKFMAGIDTSLPLAQLQQRYKQVSNTHVVDNMLYLDWKFTLADNDLMKVNYMTQMAGVKVKYPMLSEQLLALSCSIPAEIKLPGNKLRDFYKNSLKGVLPDSTINKTKQGFGLPFGKWLVQDKDLQNLVKSTLDSLSKREIFTPEFIHKAQQMHQDVHASYYGELVWIMIMLELWLQQH